MSHASQVALVCRVRKASPQKTARKSGKLTGESEQNGFVDFLFQDQSTLRSWGRGKKYLLEVIDSSEDEDELFEDEGDEI